MKIYKTPTRLKNLGLTLQYDSHLKDNGKIGFFSVSERILINQERGKILNDEVYIQPEQLESKIDNVLDKINQIGWEPEKQIEYEY